ncbi:MAG: hypothetical protein U0271_32360 [Polyangiaceae bacterium]
MVSCDSEFRVQSPTRLPRRARRVARRGVTVFIVLLVITMLGAVGIFAARASQLGVTNAGRYREAVQTHYVAEGGMNGAVSEFARDPSGYLVQMRGSTSLATPASGVYPCQDIPFASGFTPASTNCLRLGYDAVEKSARNRTGNATIGLFEKKNKTGGGESLPGSFGMGNVGGNFVVEFTDERPVEPPPAGMALAGGVGVSLKFKSVTARATGQIVPTDAAGTELAVTADTFKFTSSVETIRAEVIIGPVP